jgi:hypothetical protein
MVPACFGTGKNKAHIYPIMSRIYELWMPFENGYRTIPATLGESRKSKNKYSTLILLTNH